MSDDKAISSLEDDLKVFISKLPYWSKYLANKIITNTYSSSDIDKVYRLFLEDNKLTELSSTPREKLEIDYSAINTTSYKKNVYLKEVKDVVGVNSLVEGQVLSLNNNMTVIFGKNGSGKSSYSRLFKNAFFSRSEETILPNIRSNVNKDVSANFLFSVDDVLTDVNFPSEKMSPLLKQFSVFDNKSVIVHLDSKNEFVFKPSGLGFFSKFINVIKQVEQMLDEEGRKMGTPIDFTSLFDGESEVKKAVSIISEKSKVSDFLELIGKAEENKLQLNQLEIKKAELIALKKDKEIEYLESINKQLGVVKNAIVDINTHFSNDGFKEINRIISDKKEIENKSIQNGIKSFSHDKISNVGTKEWMDFITYAIKFADLQSSYPSTEDVCLLCQQDLKSANVELINRYSDFVKSNIEAGNKQINVKYDKIKSDYEKIKYNIIQSDSTLYKWLEEKEPSFLKDFLKSIEHIEVFGKKILKSIQECTILDYSEQQIGIDDSDKISEKIVAQITALRDKQPSQEIQVLEDQIILLKHKLKLSEHIPSIEKYISNIVWAHKASKSKGDLKTRKITECEKSLSEKYFNKKYADQFNNECKLLDADFGVDIKHSGSSGTSYRAFRLNDYQLSSILSEGEQKVISLADFLSEVYVSSINKGVIFDDPVTSLDDDRKDKIAERLSHEALERQVIIFTHDLVFLSALVEHAQYNQLELQVHWIEQLNGVPGHIWINNSPSLEKDYKSVKHAQNYLDMAKKASPELRDINLKNGFAALRTSYEALIVFELFAGVVQRFTERVSVDSLDSVYFTNDIKEEILHHFRQCCRYMEGHSHSDKYSYKKPTIDDLQTEINEFNSLKTTIKGLKKNPSGKN